MIYWSMIQGLGSRRSEHLYRISKHLYLCSYSVKVFEQYILTAEVLCMHDEKHIHPRTCEVTPIYRDQGIGPTLRVIDLLISPGAYVLVISLKCVSLK